MSKLVSGTDRYTLCDNETVWPSLDQGDLEHMLRYGTNWQITDNRFLLASIVSAYQQMINMTQKDRNYICKELREAPTTKEDS